MAFDYFDNKIDYWGKKGPRSNQVPTQDQALPQEERKIDVPSSTFDWKKQLNPKNDEFFKEGDYTPPAAFMELARNPTDDNIKNWFELIERKNQVSEKLSQRIQEYLVKNKKLKPEEQQLLVEAKSQLPKAQEDHTRFRFRMYFESSCPHCKRMLNTLQELRELGYYVEIKQIDHNPKVTEALPFPVEQASPEELKEKEISSWPVLFVGDLKNKVTYRLNGYLSTQEVLSSIRNR